MMTVTLILLNRPERPVNLMALPMLHTSKHTAPLEAVWVYNSLPCHSRQGDDVPVVKDATGALFRLPATLSDQTGWAAIDCVLKADRHYLMLLHCQQAASEIHT